MELFLSVGLIAMGLYLLWVLALLILGEKRGEQMNFRDPEVIEPRALEGEVEKDEEMPKELAELFGGLAKSKNEAGIIATKYFNFKERIKLRDEIKAARQRTEFYQAQAGSDQAKLNLLETRRDLIKRMLESGMLSQEAIAYLSRRYPGFVELSRQAQELSQLKHQREKAQLELEISRLQGQKRPRSLKDWYLERWQREGDKWAADIQGTAELRKELVKVMKRITEEINTDSELTEEEKEFLREQILRDYKQRMARGG